MRKKGYKDKTLVITSVFIVALFIFTSISTVAIEAPRVSDKNIYNSSYKEKPALDDEKKDEVYSALEEDDYSPSSASDKISTSATEKSEEYITISIPKALAIRIKEKMEDTEFTSLSSYVSYELEKLVSESEEDAEDCPLCSLSSDDQVFTETREKLEAYIGDMSEEEENEFVATLESIPEFLEYYTQISDYSEWKTINNELASNLRLLSKEYSDEEMGQILSSNADVFEELANEENFKELLSGVQSSDSEVGTAMITSSEVSIGSSAVGTTNFGDGCIRDCLEAFLNHLDQFMDEHPGVLSAIQTALYATGVLIKWGLTNYPLTTIIAAIIGGKTAIQFGLALIITHPIMSTFLFETILNAARGYCQKLCPPSTSVDSVAAASVATVASAATTAAVVANAQVQVSSSEASAVVNSQTQSQAQNSGSFSL